MLNSLANPNDIIWIAASNIGITFQYTAVQNEFINISPLFGILKNWYNATIFDWAIVRPGRADDVFFHSEKESKWGLLGGININIPIYRNFYTNANVRYSVFPTAEFNKRNLITEFGVGYRLSGKKEKQ